MYVILVVYCFFFFKQKTAYELRISDWSSDVCSSDLELADEALVEKRRGLGMYVTEEASKKLLSNERERFLTEEWPLVLERIQRLGLSMEDLLKPAFGGDAA